MKVSNAWILKDLFADGVGRGGVVVKVFFHMLSGVMTFYTAPRHQIPDPTPSGNKQLLRKDLYIYTWLRQAL